MKIQKRVIKEIKPKKEKITLEKLARITVEPLEAPTQALRKVLEDCETLTFLRMNLLDHIETRINFPSNNYHYYPGSKDFLFNLTCKQDFEDSNKFKDLKKEKKYIFDDMKNSL